jgi:hypothetical protein
MRKHIRRRVRVRRPGLQLDADVNAVISANTAGSRPATPDDERPDRESEEGNDRSASEPEAAAMSPIDANIATPVNAAVAANLLPDDAIADADAAQDAAVDQSN